MNQVDVAFALRITISQFVLGSGFVLLRKVLLDFRVSQFLVNSSIDFIQTAKSHWNVGQFDRFGGFDGTLQRAREDLYLI